MRNPLILFLFTLIMAGMVAGQCAGADVAYQQRIVPFEPEPWGPMLWPSEVPEDCPFPQSEELAGIVFTGNAATYTYSDTWYPSWGGDGNLYSPYTDGVSGEWLRSRSDHVANAVTGNARIEGDNLEDLRIVNLGVETGSSLPYRGRYPCGSLVHDGVWYYGTYCLDPYPKGYNWGTMGPFVGFRVSKDMGKTWEDCPHTPERPLFGESAKDDTPVKFGAPHVVDFGKNMELSPDGKAYLVAHGASLPDEKPRDANLSWINGDEIYLARVTPGPDTMNDESAYEYFAGHKEDGKPIWSSDFEDVRPLVEWNNNCGCVTITYNAGLDKYLMWITDGWPTVKHMDTYLLEADAITGPWKMVTYMKHFGEQGYFVNLPTKFISEDGKTGWLWYSGNFAQFADLGSNPPEGRYALCIQEIQLLSPDEVRDYNRCESERKATLAKRHEKWIENHPALSPENKAPKATVTCVSSRQGHRPEAVCDTVVDGYPENAGAEWITHHIVGGWIRLSWDTPQTIRRVLLYDAPSHNEHIISGQLRLSNGVMFDVGELPNDGRAAREISFAPQTVDYIEFMITGVGRTRRGAGISEIVVY